MAERDWEGTPVDEASALYLDEDDDEYSPLGAAILEKVVGFPLDDLFDDLFDEEDEDEAPLKTKVANQNQGQNQTFFNRRPLKWRIDEDGSLRVTICALKEGVYEYGRDELPQHYQYVNLDSIKEYIPASEMKADSALKSLEGKDIIVGCHEWQTPENYKNAQIVGSTAGTPYVENGELLVDAVIKCPETITNIISDRTPEDERYTEVSAGYDGDLVLEAGEFEGERYDAKQTNFRFNHILLLPPGQGRCGPDVKIVNSKKGKGMEKNTTVKARFGNKERIYRFYNEEDAREAEAMVEEERKFNAEQVAESLAEKERLSTEITQLKEQLAQHDANLKEAQAELEKALDENTQEMLAAEIAEQGEEEEEIAAAEEAESEEAGENPRTDAEEFLNAIRRAKNGQRANLAMRRENAVRMVMAKRGLEVPETWDRKAFDASFETLVMNARMLNQRRKGFRRLKVLNGLQTPVISNQNQNQSPRSRMLNAMRVRKGRKINE